MVAQLAQPGAENPERYAPGLTGDRTAGRDDVTEDMARAARGGGAARPRGSGPTAAPARRSPDTATPAHGSGPTATPARRSGPAPRRDDEAVTRFVEDFASALVEMGVPRMPARVFAALMTSDSGRLTAVDLAARLQVSPAAVSGAVRYLIQLGMVRREPQPGSRRHYYRAPRNVWGELIGLRDRLMARWTGVLREGAGILGADTPAGERIAESVRFFEFVSSELPLVVQRWREQEAALGGRAIGDR
jgi:DNA-binding transcriptional ArsR family regulator